MTYTGYPYWFQFRKKRSILMWLSSPERDMFMLSSQGKLLIASTESRMKELLRGENIEVDWKSSGNINFDAFWSSLKRLSAKNTSSESDCKILLEGWNFIEDIIMTFELKNLHSKLQSKTLNKAYKKLFYGNNIEAVKKDNSEYEPLWSKEESRLIFDTFTSVWSDLEQYTYKWGLD